MARAYSPGVMATDDAVLPPWEELKRLKVRPSKVLALFGVSAPPVDVFAIARGLGVALEPLPAERAGDAEGQCSGELVVHGYNAIIRYAANQSIVRQRFTVAHELGHLLLHEEGRAYRDTTFAGTPREIEANRFAADLLMPLSWVAAFADLYRDDVARLARTFQVSEKAMDYRLANVAGHR